MSLYRSLSDLGGKARGNSREHGGLRPSNVAQNNGKVRGIPWGNCRLILSEELDGEVERFLRGGRDEEDARSSSPWGTQSMGSDDDRVRGIVGRLYFSPVSHPAIRQALENLQMRFVSLPALAVQNLMNKRGPDALVGSIPGEQVHSKMLLDLCKMCHERGDALICRSRDVDVVLVPRVPEVAASDSFYFIAYATNIKAVELCESLRSCRQVAVVLDIDNTLVDAVATTLDDEEWDRVDWIHTTVETYSGKSIPAQFAHVPNSENEDPRQDRAFYIHWEVGRMICTFKVHVRRGWGYLRDFLLENRDRFAPFLCSKGKMEYVQLIWQGLDPGSRLISRDEWRKRITSTYPDTLNIAAPKTALISLGCSSIDDNQAETHLAAPIVCIDDNPEAYEQAYRSSVLLVEEYRISDEGPADFGSIMSQIQERLNTYWDITCGETGTFAWQAAQSFSTAILGAIQKTPMESADALAYLQIRCSNQGALLWRQITVESVLRSAQYVSDLDAKESFSPKSVHNYSPESSSGLEEMTRRQSFDSSRSLFNPLREVSHPGKSIQTPIASTRPDASNDDTLLDASMMMKC
eukprot:jgi/Picsp_1/4363/NSC_01869-R1_rna polymerase ii c-terminal domain phosphatase-like 2